MLDDYVVLVHEPVELGGHILQDRGSRRRKKGRPCSHTPPRSLLYLLLLDLHLVILRHLLERIGLEVILLQVEVKNLLELVLHQVLQQQVVHL